MVSQKNESQGNACPFIKLSIVIIIITVFNLFVIYGDRLIYEKLIAYVILFKSYIPYIVGYTFGVWIGNMAICPIRDLAWEPLLKIIEVKEKNYPIRNEPLMFYMGTNLGIVERVVYITAFLNCQFTFAGVWLAIKVAVQWARWKQGNVGREISNTYLLGSLLSLTYAIIGWKLIDWYNTPSRQAAVILLPILLPIASFVLWYCLRKSIKSWYPKFEDWKKMVNGGKD